MINSTMCSRKKLLAVAFILALVVPEVASAAVVLQFTGRNFEAAGLLTTFPFTTADRVTGSAVFSNIGDLQAQSVTLHVTFGGQPGFSISGVDVGVFTNWANSIPTVWELELEEDKVFGPDLDFIGISSFSGDAATIDTLSVDVALGSTLSAGQWSVVAIPEPNSCLLLGAIGTAGAILRRRMKLRQATVA